MHRYYDLVGIFDSVVEDSVGPLQADAPSVVGTAFDESIATMDIVGDGNHLEDGMVPAVHNQH